MADLVLNEKGAGYAPEGMWLWDPWFVFDEHGNLHMFHLQAEASGHPDNRHSNKVSVGHAVLTETGAWKTLPTALEPGGKSKWDEISLWTGSVFQDEDGIYWLAYTGRSADDKLHQKIGLAWSSNLDTWHKVERPIIEADGIIYARGGYVNELDKIPAFRDPYVFVDPVTGKTYMAITARQGGDQSPYNACIALYEMQGNMTKWEPCDPLLSFPRPRYDEMEVAQVILHGGLWYVFFTVAAQLIEKDWAESVGGPSSGLQCYVGKSLTGPFTPVNSHGGVYDSDDIRGLRLIGEPDANGRFLAMGWVDDVEDIFGGCTSLWFWVTLEKGLVIIEQQ